MKYKTVKKLWLAAAILTTTTSLWTNVNAMETPAASGAGVIRALNEQRILSEQYALQQIQTGAGELAEGEAAGEAEMMWQNFHLEMQKRKCRQQTSRNLRLQSHRIM
ncbi:MAG: hypothetical protein ACLSV3_00110 [Roseburia sp.]